MNTSRITKADLRSMALDLVALEKEAKGINTGRFKWELYPIPAKAAEVRKTRKALGFSRKVLASIVGVSPITVKAWEIGQRTPDGPATKILRAIRAKPEIALIFGNV